ncbi:ECF RNA polymerase sigma-E factor [Phycisphaerae bacterium RAS1]|nr:ECF RNA polymerase sigma-E factor [Phycisphaerae bacterium RAS1]
MTTALLDVEALRDLVCSAQRGDRRAADRLVREHDAWLRSVVFGVTGRPDIVDDIAQQVWTQVWERLDSLKDPQRLRSWLYAIARHAAIDAGMAQRRRQSLVGSLESTPTPPADRRQDEPSGTAARSELRETLLRAIESLPALYREPFALRHLEDWSYAQIGEVLGLPVETVETRLVRARRLLKEMLEGKLE